MAGQYRASSRSDAFPVGLRVSDGSGPVRKVLPDALYERCTDEQARPG